MESRKPQAAYLGAFYVQPVERKLERLDGLRADVAAMARGSRGHGDSKR